MCQFPDRSGIQCIIARGLASRNQPRNGAPRPRHRDAGDPRRIPDRGRWDGLARRAVSRAWPLCLVPRCLHSDSCAALRVQAAPHDVVPVQERRAGGGSLRPQRARQHLHPPRRPDRRRPGEAPRADARRARGRSARVRQRDRRRLPGDPQRRRDGRQHRGCQQPLRWNGNGRSPALDSHWASSLPTILQILALNSGCLVCRHADDDVRAYPATDGDHVHVR